MYEKALLQKRRLDLVGRAWDAMVPGYGWMVGFLRVARAFGSVRLWVCMGSGKWV